MTFRPTLLRYNSLEPSACGLAGMDSTLVPLCSSVPLNMVMLQHSLPSTQLYLRVQEPYLQCSLRRKLFSK